MKGGVFHYFRFRRAPSPSVSSRSAALAMVSLAKVQPPEASISSTALRAAPTVSCRRAAQADAAASQAALAEQASAVASREAAVSAVEKQVQANSIEEGTWTVGTDVAAGTYRTSAAISGDCYWSITKSGTNGSDIIDHRKSDQSRYSHQRWGTVDNRGSDYHHWCDSVDNHAPNSSSPTPTSPTAA